MLLASILATLVAGLGSGPVAEDPKSIEFAAHGLKFDFSRFQDLQRNATPDEDAFAEWTARLGEAGVSIELRIVSAPLLTHLEAEGVIGEWRDEIRDPETGLGETYDFAFETMRCVPGPLGAAPFGAATRAHVREKGGDTAASIFLVGSILEEKAWALRVDVFPALDAAAAKDLATFLDACARYTGKAREPKWTDAEALAYWNHFAPEGAKKKTEKPFRSEHYLVLSDSPSANSFAKKLEAWYADVRKIMPFEEQKGRRLMPVLFFRTGVEFDEFYRNQYGLKAQDIVTTRSDSDGAWFATSLDAARESLQVFYAAQQLMRNRAHCFGGCSWFRMGLPWYMGSKPADRVEGLRFIKKGKGTPLEKLLDDEAWGEHWAGRELKGVSDEGNYSDQAAAWWDFLHQGPLKDKFNTLLTALGSLSEGDSPGTLAVIQTVYGLEPRVLQAKMQEYAQKK